MNAPMCVFDVESSLTIDVSIQVPYQAPLASCKNNGTGMLQHNHSNG